MTRASLQSLAGWLALLLLPAVATRGEDTTDRLVSAAIEAEGRLDPRAALELFREAARARPDDAFIQQKIAQQLSDSAFLETDPVEQARLASEALPHAQKAVNLDPQSAVARLSLSVLHGKLAINGDARTKVDHARQIYRHAKEALALEPEYAWAWHVLGRWHVELSQLGLARRALVEVFFGGLPKASLDEGIRSLEKAVALEGDAVAHQVELGFAYLRANRVEQARARWVTALELPSIRVFDEVAKRRAQGALTDLPQGK